MKFNTKVDISSITMAHMQRQRNDMETKDDEMPKFGAGSEYGREQRQEARRKKRGYIKKGVKDEDLPWLLKTGGKGGKRYTGVKEANISQNAAYYVFSQCADGSFEACPVDSLYRFTPVINYRTFTADEAEEKFSKRNKTINYSWLKVKERLVDTEATEKSASEETPVPKVKSKLDKLQLYNDDDLGDMSNEEGDDEEEHVDEEKFQKAKKKLSKTKKSENDDDDSDIGEMEDGYFDSKEVDYMSDSSSSEEESKEKQRDTRPQAEDDLNAQLNPESEDDSELEDDKLSKGGLLLKDILKQNDESSGDDDEEEIDEDETQSAVLLQGQKKKGKKTGSASSTSSSSRSDTPTKGMETSDRTITDAAKKLKDISSSAHGKKRSKSSPTGDAPNKKPRKETESPSNRCSAVPSSSRANVGETETQAPRGSPEVGITEETVRRYLSYKPMTTKDLLKKFKTKKTGLTSEQTVQQIAAILRRIQPEQNMVKGKLYLSLKQN